MTLLKAVHLSIGPRGNARSPGEQAGKSFQIHAHRGRLGCWLRYRSVARGVPHAWISGCFAGRIRVPTREKHPRAAKLVELGPNSTQRAVVFQKQSREATGTGRRGVSPRAYPWGCNHNGCSGASQFLPSKCLCRLDRGPIRPSQEWRTLNACLQSGFETFPATRFHGTLHDMKM
jgi:hypothetical protein